MFRKVGEGAAELFEFVQVAAPRVVETSTVVSNKFGQGHMSKLAAYMIIKTLFCNGPLTVSSHKKSSNDGDASAALPPPYLGPTLRRSIFHLP